MTEKKNDNQGFMLAIFGVTILILPFIVIAALIVSDPRSQASSGAQPQEVIFSNMSANSFTVSYVTEDSVQGSVSVSGGASGIVPGADTRDESGAGEYKTHYIVVGGLQPEAEYEVAINSGGETFTDPAWKVTTPPINDQVGVPKPVRGKVTPPVTDAVVYAMMGDTSGNSTVASTLITSESNSTFVLDKNSFIKSDGKPYKQEEMQGKDILTYVNGLDQGKARTQFASTEDSAGEMQLSADVQGFSPSETITPGSDAGTGTITDDGDDDEPIESEYGLTLDAFAEGLLNSTYSTGAEAELPQAPYDIFISNVSNSGFTVNWRTMEPNVGYIQVLEGGQESNVIDPRDGSIENVKKRYTHSAEAQSGAIEGGMIFQFQIVSGEVVFGKNVDDVVQDYNSQYREYVEEYFPSAEGEGEDIGLPSEQVAGGAAGNGSSDNIATTGSGAEGQQDIPPFEYVPSAELAIEPFEVIIPGAPDSPPLPVAVQGQIGPKIDLDGYADLVTTAATNNPNVQKSEIDLTRDVLVAAKTSNGTWATSTITESGGFSISIGSSLTTEKDKYVEVSDGDSIDAIAFGYLNQAGEQSLTYADEPVDVDISNPFAILTLRHTEGVKEPIFFGGGEDIELTLNGVAEQVTEGSDGSWKLEAQSVETGLNELTIGSGGSSYTILFAVGADVLPVTGLGEDLTILIIGGLVLLAGVVFYKKYVSGGK